VQSERKLPRKIIHIDMDAFYAAVEQHDNPSLRGKPVIVGGYAEKRGVVSAASYEARAYGVHSAMPTSQAKRLCPQGIFLPVRMGRYQEVSEQIFQVLRGYTPLVEPLSLDESFLDVTGSERLFGPAVKIAKEIKQRIQEITGLTASAGIAPNKLLAKIASDLRKPDGLVEIKPEEVQDFLRNLPISRLWGVGKNTEEVLRGMGILRVGSRVDQPGGNLHPRPLGPGNDEKGPFGSIRTSRLGAPKTKAEGIHRSVEGSLPGFQSGDPVRHLALSDGPGDGNISGGSYAVGSNRGLATKSQTPGRRHLQPAAPRRSRATFSFHLPQVEDRTIHGSCGPNPR